MSDIKLFRITSGLVSELEGRSVGVEKSLQTLVEENLEAFLGVRFLASEYSTGKTHGGRIDTLGIDENSSPVIIEYKRAVSETVINQGLFYLDWLMDHQAEFTLLAMKQLGPGIEDQIDWSSPRLLCVAGDFNKYDEHAVQQMNRNTELLRYGWYEDGYLVLEPVNATTGTTAAAGEANTKHKYATVTELYAKAGADLQDLSDTLEAYPVAGDYLTDMSEIGGVPGQCGVDGAEVVGERLLAVGPLFGVQCHGVLAHSRSPGENRRWASRARSSAAEAP